MPIGHYPPTHNPAERRLWDRAISQARRYGARDPEWHAHAALKQYRARLATNTDKQLLNKTAPHGESTH